MRMVRLHKKTENVFMRKMKKIAISIMSCALVAMGSLAIILSDPNKVVNAETSISVAYEETYELGETVAIQAAEFDHNGKKYQANASVRFPNGDTYKYDQLVLTEAGKYYVYYSAVADDGTVLQETASFTVLADVYTLNGKGEYTYGSNDYLPEEVEGLNVSLARNTTLKINTPIDVSNLTKDDSILKFYATPTTKGTADVGVVYVRLTDAHDESKYVEWQYRPKGSFQYVYATANDQPITGLAYTGSPSNASVEYDGYYYNVSHNIVNNAGHVSRVSMTGEMDGNNEKYLSSQYFKNQEYTEQEMFFYNSIECRMDYQQKRLYSQPDGQYAIKRCIIGDFDDERTLGGKEPWEGFTTGEAFISIYATDYTSSSFNFFITEICGQDVSQTKMVNELAPRLTVDTGDYQLNNLPNAIVGVKYDLFNAVATDDTDGDLDVSVKVYNSIGATMSVVGGSFVPTQAGVYTIEYTASDSFENKTVKTVTVKAINRDSFDYELSDGQTQFKAGEVVSVKELTLLDPANLYDLEISAKNAAQNVEYLIDGDDLTFVPLYAGTYTVTYLYTDYCAQEEITYDIVVTNSDLVVFEDDIILPRYIIKGINYPVVPLYAYTFANSTQREAAELYIKEGSGEERLIAGDTYSVENDVTTVALVYKAGGSEKTYQLPVIDAVNLEEYKVDLAKYFYDAVGDFNAVGDAKKIKFEVAASVDGVAKLDVINPARLINDFNIGFHFETGATNFTAVKVLLESAYDPDKVVEFKFERDIGNVAKVAVSSENFFAESGISSQFRTPVNTSDNFNITYNSTTKEFDIGGFIVSASELLEDFDDLFYISFEMQGISDTAAINITRVVNQQITNDEYDGVKPTIFYGSYKGYYVVGDELNVNAVQVYDFVDPNPTCTLSLQNTLGYMTSTDGVKLDGTANDVDSTYVVNVEKVSRMNLKISCEDFSGNSYPINLPLMVKDVVAPMIQINVVNNLYKAGDTVTIADYLIEDDTTAQGNLAISYYLISSDGSVKYLSSTSFEIEEAGEYVIYYIVRDEAGNNAYANYQIFVE